MSEVEGNKDIVRKLYEESLNKRNMGLLQDFISEDYSGRDGKKGVQGFKETVMGLIKAFPDAEWEIEGLFADDNIVFVLQRLHGTHKGQFRNFASTGNRISVDGIGIYELEDGRIINSRVQTDQLGFLQQLGVLPQDISVLAKAGSG